MYMVTSFGGERMEDTKEKDEKYQKKGGVQMLAPEAMNIPYPLL